MNDTPTPEDTTDWLSAPMDPELRAYIQSLRDEVTELRGRRATNGEDPWV